MEHGTITTLQVNKGYGFISSHGEDYFFHFRDLAEGLEFGEMLMERRVRFTVVTTPRGNRAVGVSADE